MPVYEFECSHCRQRFELLTKGSQAPRTATCPKCGATKVQRVMSTFAAHQAAAGRPAEGGGCGRCGDPYGPCGLEN